MSIERARDLRKSMSDAERHVWRAIRGGQINGFRFRRQHPIGVFIADFICLEKRLIIEVDGSQHAEPKQLAHDLERTAWLESRGYLVMRVWTGEISENLEGVLTSISQALEQSPVKRDRPPPPRRATIT
jgi:very-short-patch-repair endonuclease